MDRPASKDRPGLWEPLGRKVTRVLAFKVLLVKTDQPVPKARLVLVDSLALKALLVLVDQLGLLDKQAPKG